MPAPAQADRSTLASAEIDSPIGGLLVVASASAVVSVSFEGSDWNSILARERSGNEDAGDPVAAQAMLERATGELEDYFAGLLRAFNVPFDLGPATPFRRRILDLTAGIPFGETRSYADLAEAVGSPRAVRATGSAMGSNPVPIIVPCHRVVRSDGAPGGFGGGSARKAKLLRFERSGRL